MSGCHFFTGKGGVGKTTLAAAMAIVSARAHPTLLLEMPRRHSLGKLFEQAVNTADSPSRVPAHPNLFVAQMDRQAALAAYLKRFLGPAASHVARLASFQKLVDAAPGVSELLFFDTLLASIQRFESVIVDFESTGHAQMLLALPARLHRISSGPVQQTALAAEHLLSRSLVHVSNTPGEVVTTETRAFIAASQNLPPSLGTLFINRTHPADTHENLRTLGLETHLIPELPLGSAYAITKAITALHDKGEIKLPSSSLDSLADLSPESEVAS